MMQPPFRGLLLLMCFGTLVTLTLFLYYNCYIRKNSEHPEISPVLLDNQYIFTLEQNDSRLIEYVRKNSLTPPPPSTSTSKGVANATFFSQVIWDLFKKKGKGFKGTFVEAGAQDGADASNTHFLETKGWNGILIEPNPLAIPKLFRANRTSWISTACLSSQSSRAEKTTLYSLEEWPQSAQVGSPLDEAGMNKHELNFVKNKTWVPFEVTCFPLYTIIKAAGQFEEIDFLSLDVQGVEIGILNNFPFDKMKIRAIVVEVHTFTEGQKTGLRNFMKSKGYDVKNQGWIDDFYVLKGEF